MNESEKHLEDDWDSQDSNREDHERNDYPDEYEDEED
jgi:hypothetical protein